MPELQANRYLTDIAIRQTIEHLKRGDFTRACELVHHCTDLSLNEVTALVNQLEKAALIEQNDSWKERHGE